MTRKPYADLIKERVGALSESKDVMLYWGEGRPSTSTLGHVFEHVYMKIEAKRKNPIMRAFRDCDLDLDNPFHWADLLRVLCDLHFAPRKNPGKRKRTPEFFRALRHDRTSVVKKHGRVGQSAQARLLASEFPERYGKQKYKFKTLLRIIQEKDSKARAKKRRKS
jgi:hypothetical protein